MNLTGRPQDVLLDVAGQVLTFRPTVEGAVVTIEPAAPAPTVAITDPDGAAVAILEAPAISGNNLTLEREWVSATTPEDLADPYKAVWTFKDSVGGKLWALPQRFFLLAELWVSQVVEADVTGLDSQVKKMVGSAALAPWIREAWGDLWDLVYKKTTLHPSRWPADRFREAHIEQTKFRLYAYSITRKPDDRWESLAGMHQSQAKEMVEAILADPSIIVRGADAGVGKDKTRRMGYF